jgi:hypothetical protein
MAEKQSSLLDDAEFSRIGQSKDAKNAGGASNPQTTKIVVVGALFVVSVGILAWYYWPEPPPPSARPGNPAALSTAETQAAEQQDKKVKERLTQPETVTGGS